jgi:hypothetical protein
VPRAENTLPAFHSRANDSRHCIRGGFFRGASYSRPDNNWHTHSLSKSIEINKNSQPAISRLISISKTRLILVVRMSLGGFAVTSS